MALVDPPMVQGKLQSRIPTDSFLWTWFLQLPMSLLCVRMPPPSESHARQVQQIGRPARSDSPKYWAYRGRIVQPYRTLAVFSKTTPKAKAARRCRVPSLNMLTGLCSGFRGQASASCPWRLSRIDENQCVACSRQGAKNKGVFSFVV